MTESQRPDTLAFEEEHTVVNVVLDKPQGVVNSIQALARSVVQVHVVLNGHFEGQGQRNGQMLMKLIGDVRRQTRL